MTSQARDAACVRRLGHEPVVKITHYSGNLEPTYHSACRWCKRWLTVELATGKVLS